MSHKPIYFDYMATTPIDPRVIEVMLNFMGPTAHFGNPSSIHLYGQVAAQAIERAREQVALSVGAIVDEIVFTSGATESINMAILGAARFYQRKGRHVVTMHTEHKAVLDSFKQLEREGFVVTYLKPEADGLLDLSTLKQALQPDTILLSIMHANNEIGVVNDIGAIGELIKGRGIVFHVDAAQSAGKLPINVRQLSVDLMSFSAHKNYGPKGVGALYVRQQPRIRLTPLSFGGGQEGGLRAGTLPTHQIVGMGEAFALGEEIRSTDQTRILNLRKRLWAGISSLPGIQLNGHEEMRVAGNLNFSVQGIGGHDLLIALSELALSTGSACAAARHEPSYVLRAIGLSEERANSSVRLSLGRYTTEDEVSRAIELLCLKISELTR